MQTILEHAVEEERRRRFFDEADAAYAKLRAEPEAWAGYQDELALWDSTLMDGLKEEPPYPSASGSPASKRTKKARR